MKQPNIKMIQESTNRWRIESDTGIVLTDDIILGKLEAEDYMKRYISSYSTWTYEIIPMGGIYVKPIKNG